MFTDSASPNLAICESFSTGLQTFLWWILYQLHTCSVYTVRGLFANTSCVQSLYLILTPWEPLHISRGWRSSDCPWANARKEGNQLQHCILVQPTTAVQVAEKAIAAVQGRAIVVDGLLPVYWGLRCGHCPVYGPTRWCTTYTNL